MASFMGRPKPTAIYFVSEFLLQQAEGLSGHGRDGPLECEKLSSRIRAPACQRPQETPVRYVGGCNPQGMCRTVPAIHRPRVFGGTKHMPVAIGALKNTIGRLQALHSATLSIFLERSQGMPSRRSGNALNELDYYRMRCVKTPRTRPSRTTVARSLHWTPHSVAGG